MQWIALHIKTTPRHPKNQGILNSCKKSWKGKFQIPQNPAIIHPRHLKSRSTLLGQEQQVTQSNPHKTGTTNFSYLIHRESFRSLKNFKPNDFLLECKNCKILMYSPLPSISRRSIFMFSYVAYLLKVRFICANQLFSNVSMVCASLRHNDIDSVSQGYNGNNSV